MSHVGLAEQRGRPRHRRRSGHAFARCERAAGEASTVDRLRLDRVGAIFLRLDDDVVSLADADAELVDLDRLHVLPVGLHDLHP